MTSGRVSRDTVFQVIRPGACFETGYFVKESLGRLPCRASHRMKNRTWPRYTTKIMESDALFPGARFLVNIKNSRRSETVSDKNCYLYPTTRLSGLSRPSWERETGLQLSRQEIFLYWAGTPKPAHRQTNRLLLCTVRCALTGAAQRELSRRANGGRFFAPGYGCLPRAD